MLSGFYVNSTFMGVGAHYGISDHEIDLRGKNVETWDLSYERPHSSLGNLTPAEYTEGFN